MDTKLPLSAVLIRVGLPNSVHDNIKKNDYSVAEDNFFSFFCNLINHISSFLPSAPDQQAPADLTPLSSTAVGLNWLPPEAPNGVILYYVVYRNGIPVTNTSQRAYNDTGLLPHTTYTYAIQAANVIGRTTSYATSVTTLDGVPQGLAAPNVTVLGATSVLASWTPPLQPNGIIARYELILGGGGASNGVSSSVFSGQALSTTVNGLQPYMSYTLLVQACTSGGCGPSNTTGFLTLQAAPSSQPSPAVTTVNATAVRVDWTAPPTPNGVLTQYDVRERGAPFSGNGALVQSLGAGVFSLVVGGLAPFTTYQFAVVSYTAVGSAQSNWTSGRTNEAGMFVQSVSFSPLLLPYHNTHTTHTHVPAQNIHTHGCTHTSHTHMCTHTHTCMCTHHTLSHMYLYHTHACLLMHLHSFPPPYSPFRSSKSSGSGSLLLLCQRDVV